MVRAAKPTQPVKTAPNQAYGVAGQQAAAQASVPLPNNAGQLASISQAAATPPQQPPTAGPAPQQPGPPPQYAGELGGFNDPTALPHQPVTHGSPSGAGPGPEVLAGGPTPNIAQTIAQIAATSGNPDIATLAARAQAQGGSH